MRLGLVTPVLTRHPRNDAPWTEDAGPDEVARIATAADRLGWDYTFETRLLAVGAIDFGFLDGDLLVVGSGDPTIDDWDGIASQLFERWAERLKAAEDDHKALMKAELTITALEQKSAAREAQLKASEDERKDMARQLQELRERLAKVEGATEVKPMPKIPSAKEKAE